jgi:hypothetical protein
MMSGGRRQTQQVLIFSSVMAVVALLLFTDLAFCPMRRFFGIPCPLCGFTRATRSMLTLDFGAMLRFHPLAPLVVILGAWQFVRPVPRSVWFGVALAFLGLYVLRFMGHFGGLPDPIEPFWLGL